MVHTLRQDEEIFGVFNLVHIQEDMVDESRENLEGQVWSVDQIFLRIRFVIHWIPVMEPPCHSAILMDHPEHPSKNEVGNHKIKDIFSIYGLHVYIIVYMYTYIYICIYNIYVIIYICECDICSKYVCSENHRISVCCKLSTMSFSGQWITPGHSSTRQGMTSSPSCPLSFEARKVQSSRSLATKPILSNLWEKWKSRMKGPMKKHMLSIFTKWFFNNILMEWIGDFFQ